MDKRPIGVMDSGLGGLSVIRVLREQLPHESVIFVGDQGYFPYGTKTREQVQQLALRIGKFLVKQDVKMMIIACNTATAAALQLLQNELPIPVIGVIEPGARAATQHHYKKIGVIGTESTIKNGAYAKILAKLNPALGVISSPAQPLVSIVEHGQTGTILAQKTVDTELEVFDNQSIEALILGCTHFPFLQKEIHNKLGANVQLIDPAFETIRQARELLTSENQLSDNLTSRVELYSTGDVKDLVAGAQKWLPNRYNKCAHIQLNEED
ncbi:glutamate racemase [Limosilactobacillus agrestis]|uniref:Glutamate racemase n=1 Tax=Limosilactobacillus agrestis TaxID=2759748 RepID=A0ABS8R8J6_9LACO|nr:glutamate racemase [Limosilactobacillus agrestis]MBB1098969.1 glutamate racemase [Limosilactobacillus agrestis]MCD7112623.1 glutamate racemase [Limosilactobacillus agrestis]MCD7126180.1 glutamate racemase [Limosilactobacillus agrestis]MCD7131121.1 glutamate racemase [Limosilactobacillus agrestis]